MSVAIKSSWALFVGIALIMLGNGLQGSLLGLRASSEGFSTSVTGLVMSGYFAGFLIGSFFVPKMVTAVGHIRVFAALASLASTAVLMHIIVIEPWFWVVMRLVTGFSYAGLYVVAESWINDKATNETRGQLLAAYMVVVLGGMGAGQILLNLGDPDGFALFILSSVLISLAVVPLLLNASPAPGFEAPSKVGLRELYRMSPLGVVASFGTGMAHGTLFGMAAVYAEQVGLTVAGVSFFVGMIFVGGVLLQWPIGFLSDKFDRRRVLTVVTLIAAAAALGGATLGGFSNYALFFFIGIFGGVCMPLYSLCIAHTNDNLTPEQMVAASSTLYIFVGLGASIGPTSAAFLMDLFGPGAYFYFLFLIHAAIGLFALYRMTRRESVPLAEQGPTIPVASTATSVVTALSAESAIEEMSEEG